MKLYTQGTTTHSEIQCHQVSTSKADIRMRLCQHSLLQSVPIHGHTNSEHLFYCFTFTLHERERECFEHASCFHLLSWDVDHSKMTHWCCKRARPNQMDTGSLQSRGDNDHHLSTGTSAGIQNHENPPDRLLKIHIYT